MDKKTVYGKQTFFGIPLDQWNPVPQTRNTPIIVAERKFDELFDELWSQPERRLDANRIEDVLFAIRAMIVRGTSTCCYPKTDQKSASDCPATLSMMIPRTSEL